MTPDLNEFNPPAATLPEPPPLFHKTTFLNEIKPGTGTDTGYFQITETAVKTASNGKLYLDLTLADRTGQVNGKQWDIKPDHVPFPAGSIVKVEFAPELFRDALQLKVYGMRLVDRGSVAMEDYLPASKRDRAEMFSELHAWLAEIQDAELILALDSILNNLHPQLLDAPAAMKKHQAYLGGLLEHILRLLHLAKRLSEVYPDLNRDVLYAGCILHDIGKVVELRYDGQIDYTIEGSLLGHIAQGLALWSEYTPDLDPVLRHHINHVIASHHGQLEFGALKPPMTREAQLFHLLDMIDSRYEMFTNAVAGGVDANGLTGWQKDLGVRVWNGQQRTE